MKNLITKLHQQSQRTLKIERSILKKEIIELNSIILEQFSCIKQTINLTEKYSRNIITDNTSKELVNSIFDRIEFLRMEILIKNANLYF